MERIQGKTKGIPKESFEGEKGEIVSGLCLLPEENQRTNHHQQT